MLYVILADVFWCPLGTGRVASPGPVLLAIPILLAKAVGVGTIFAVIDNSFSKLRLYKITEFMASASRCRRSQCSCSTWEVGNARGLPAAVPQPPSVFDGVTEALAVLVLLVVFAMMREALLRSQVRLYAVQSLAVSALAGVLASSQHAGELYALACISFFLKVVVVPAVVLRLLREAEVDLAGSHRFGVATMVLVGVVVSVIAFLTVSDVHVVSSGAPAYPYRRSAPQQPLCWFRSPWSSSAAMWFPRRWASSQWRTASRWPALSSRRGCR